MHENDADRLSFLPLTPDDFPLLHRWLNTPHVSKWWFSGKDRKTISLEEVRDKYTKRIEGTDPVHCYIVYLNKQPVVYIQWYRIHDLYESNQIVPDDSGVAGIDIFIGEPDFLYRGLGPAVIQKLLRQIIFEEPDITACIIDPEPANTAAIRAYRKTGFVFQYTVRTEQQTPDAYVMRMEKP